MPEHGLLGNESGLPVLFALIGLFIAAYLLGGINSAILVSKIGYKDDIRKYGSKNAGLTNVLRTYGKKAALITLLGDVGKAVLACFIGQLFFGTIGAYIAGCGAVIGHIWPIYFKFKGGKGVLAFATMVLYCNPTVFLLMFTIYFVIAAFTKYISLASVMCVLIYPLILTRFESAYSIYFFPVLIVSVIIAIKHWSNIKRLRAGEENKVRLGKNGGNLPNWLLIIVAVVLVCACALTIFLQIAVNSGTLDRSHKAVVCGETEISQLVLRVMFISEKNAYFGENEQNDDHDREIMDLTLQKASDYALFNRAAQDKGYAITPETERYLNNYLSLVVPTLDGYIEGETANSYTLRKYKTGAKGDDLLAAVRAKLYAEEFIRSIGEEAASEYRNNDNYKVTINEKYVDAIIKKY